MGILWSARVDQISPFLATLIRTALPIDCQQGKMDPNTSAEALEVVPFAHRHTDDNHHIKTEDDVEVVPRLMEPGGLTLPSISDYPRSAQDNESYSDGRYELNGPVHTFLNQSGVQPFFSLTRVVPVTDEIEAYGQPAMSVEIPARHHLTYPAPEPPSLYHPQTTLPGLDQMTAFHRPVATTYNEHEWTEQNRGNAGIEFTELNNSSQHQIPRTSYRDDNHLAEGGTAYSRCVLCRPQRPGRFQKKAQPFWRSIR